MDKQESLTFVVVPGLPVVDYNVRVLGQELDIERADVSRQLQAMGKLRGAGAMWRWRFRRRFGGAERPPRQPRRGAHHRGVSARGRQQTGGGGCTGTALPRGGGCGWVGGWVGLPPHGARAYFRCTAAASRGVGTKALRATETGTRAQTRPKGARLQQHTQRSGIVPAPHDALVSAAPHGKARVTPTARAAPATSAWNAWARRRHAGAAEARMAALGHGSGCTPSRGPLDHGECSELASAWYVGGEPGPRDGRCPFYF